MEEHEVTRSHTKSYCEGTGRVTVDEHEVTVKEREELLWRNTK